jgi:hypothetical protein
MISTTMPGSTEDWLKLEEGKNTPYNDNIIENSFYSSRSRVGITGFFMDCIAGKQDEINDEESLGSQQETQTTGDSIISVLAASTQMILSTVTNMTAGITNLFSWNSQIPYQLSDTASPNYNKTDFSNLIEVVIEGYDNQNVTNTTEIESPRLSTIKQSSNLHESTTKPSQTELIANEEDSSEYVDSGNYWYEPNFDDEECEEEDNDECNLSSLSSPMFAMKSYIDFSMDANIVQKPIPKRNNIKKRDIRVKFEPIVELMDHVVNNDKAAIKKILQAGSINVNDHDKLGYTMMHYAACHNHLDLIKYLIEKGANVNSLDFTNWSPLHMSAIADNYKICKFLLDNGANFECPNDDSNLPIDLAEDAKIKKLFQEATKKKNSAKKVKAIYDWTAQSPECLSIKKLETLRVMERQNQDWWLLQNDQKQIGLVPRSFVQ